MVLDPLGREIEMTETQGTVATDKEVAAAQKLGSEIVAVAKTTAADFATGLDTFRFLIAQAKDAPHFLAVAVVGQVFDDWKGYVDHVLAEVPNMPAPMRAEFGKVLKSEGMTIREIADTLKTAKSQVQRDVQGISQRATARVDKDAAKARGETGTPKPRSESNVTTHAVSALDKCQKVARKDAETVYPLRSEKVTDANLIEYRAMLVQSLADVDAEIERRKTDAEFAAIVAEVTANPAQFKDVVAKAKAKANHPSVTGRPANGNNPRTGSTERVA
jgi:hypothetical protein